MDDDVLKYYFGYDNDWPFDLDDDPFDDFENEGIEEWDSKIWSQIHQEWTPSKEKNNPSSCKNVQAKANDDCIALTKIYVNPNNQTTENQNKVKDQQKQNIPPTQPPILLNQTQTQNLLYQQTPALDKIPRCPNGSRKILSLTGGAEEFRVAFYHLTYGKKFSKLFVQKLHNAVCSSLNLRRMNREEARSIKLYFLHFAKDGFQIINAVRSYIEENPDIVDEINVARTK